MPIKRGLSRGGSSTVAKRLPVHVPTKSIPPALPGILKVSLADLERPTSATLIRLYAALTDAHVKQDTLIQSRKTLHCVRCHEKFKQKSNGMKACILDHDDDGPDRRKYGGEYFSKYHCCGLQIETGRFSNEDQFDDMGPCFEGPHTTDPKRVHYRPNGAAVTCEDMNCESSHEDDDESDDEDDDEPDSDDEVTLVG